MPIRIAFRGLWFQRVYEGYGCGRGKSKSYFLDEYITRVAIK